MQQSAPAEPSELAPSGQIDQVKVVGGKLRRKSWGRFPIFAAAFSAALALGACASSEYMGISLKPGDSRALACLHTANVWQISEQLSITTICLRLQ